MRYILRRKSDGSFYAKKNSYRNNAWTPDLQGAWVYKQKGGPKNTLYGIGWLPFNQGGRNQTQADRAARAKIIFDRDYEILEVELKLR